MLCTIRSVNVAMLSHLSSASIVLVVDRFGAGFTEGVLLRGTCNGVSVFLVAVQRGSMVTLALAVVHDLFGQSCRALPHVLCFRRAT